jgi:hypothetical protein
MAGLQANWDFLSDFQQRGTLALDALRAQAAQSPWGVASNGRILDEPRLRSMEEMYLPDKGWETLADPGSGEYGGTQRQRSVYSRSVGPGFWPAASSS